MAISNSISSRSGEETPLLLDYTVEGVVDYKGSPVLRSKSGGWRSAGLIIGVEITERFAYYGISSNLINFLTGPLGQSTATAAENVNAWSGTSLLLPLLGAFVADSFLGRYRTIVVASVLYLIIFHFDKIVTQSQGIGLLALSTLLPFYSPSLNQINKTTISTGPSQFQVVLFFFSLYLVAFAQGGHKPCVQAFGADQFNGEDPEESKAKSSFFNWWYFGLNSGTVVTYFTVSYIQENLSWALGFGVPCIAMIIGFIVFLAGTRTYRYTNIKQDEKSPFLRISTVFITAIRNWRTDSSAIATEEESHGRLPQQSSVQFKFLNKALIVPNGSKEDGKTYCSVAEVEEAKAVLRLVPIWGTCLAYAIVFAQSSTFFTKQGATMKRTIVPGFEIPAASLQSFLSLAIVLFVPIYDRFLVPVARVFTRKPSGITMLQRIGTGMVLSALSMVVSAVVETKRLKIAQEYDLVDRPSVTVPISVWWLLPQYVMFGIADVFTMVGLQEFFYDQVPNELRSIGLALYLSIFGAGSFLSSFLVSAIDEVTGGSGQDSWFATNLNRGHLDYFYWLLAVLSAFGFGAYLYFARSYIYKV
ncbi:protein NRT1/ PTR FAMILY 5.10 isoform X3 [Ziziphus jujuba]|uniref:Protein NRT1/ PTR FAMILY 5.10 isoform X3 n=1 Tax=Ziziphus jujuba TaxID=326968 RepID=A0ABM3INS9_ZIZJJ|nr:protein NRT1/ PTR FAMILY 5.10 isoform X3 [Ziziphus jujuba]